MEKTVLPSKEAFATLLKQAIHRIKRLTKKLAPEIRQELGNAINRNATTIEHWGRSDNPTLPKQTELEGLAEAIYAYLLDQAWLDKFLLHGGHADPDPFSEYLADKHEEKPPAPRADKIVGRAEYIQAIRENLENPRGDLIITIDGLGGIGKTAIASKIHDLFLLDALFDKVIWISADRSDIPTFLKDLDPFDFDTILNSIGQQLGEQEIKKLDLTQKANLIRNLLKKQRCLIILDNLETADIPQYEIIELLRPFLNPSRALLTSRRRFTGDLYQIHLSGLEATQAIELMNHLGKEKSIPIILQGERHNLKQIHQVTGGSPLAIKLVVGLLKHVPLQTALKHLEKATPLDRVASEDEYLKFYRYIFIQAWRLLNDEDEKLLMGLAQFNPAEGIPFGLIANMPGLTPEQLTTGIQFLWRLSLLEVQEQTNLKDILYYLHPLTRYFVLSDMVKREDLL
ncbi:MAG: hypothetical protein DWQ04_12980 [Chloroflexi bacterium]|nr:MAG: hypothetical protein DWQ04_12980 [Chloroflexota bacterium]